MSVSVGACGRGGELNLSRGSGGGSRGASRTPSPFGFSSSNAISAPISAPSYALPAALPPNHTLPPSHAHPGSHLGNGFGLGPGAVPDIPMRLSGAELLRPGGVQGEVYSRKVFVGGLPPDIDQGT